MVVTPPLPPLLLLPLPGRPVDPDEDPSGPLLGASIVAGAPVVPSPPRPPGAPPHAEASNASPAPGRNSSRRNTAPTHGGPSS
jgi:hypothetical protein